MSSYLKLWFYLVALSIVASLGNSSRLLGINREVRVHNNDQVASGEKVRLQLYYEAWCPGCGTFHVYTLDKVLNEIGAYIDLKTYPYGNAQRTRQGGKMIFTCQHGPGECYGNKLHACAIDVLKNPTQSEFYNSCMMKGQWGGRGSTDLDATNCGQLMQIDSRPIIECARGQRGDALLEYYGKETDVSGKQYVPYLLLNGQAVDVQRVDLKKAVCNALSNPPPACNN